MPPAADDLPGKFTSPFGGGDPACPKIIKRRDRLGAPTFDLKLAETQQIIALFGELIVAVGDRLPELICGMSPSLSEVSHQPLHRLG